MGTLGKAIIIAVLALAGSIAFYFYKKADNVIVASNEIYTMPEHKLGPYSAQHRFIEIPCNCIDHDTDKFYFKGTSYYQSYHFKTVKRKTASYSATGKKTLIPEGQLLKIDLLYTGTFNGKEGLWGKFFNYDYIFLDDLKDVELEEQVARNKYLKEKIEKEEEQRKEEGKNFFNNIKDNILLYFVISLVIIMFIVGFSTYNPANYNPENMRRARFRELDREIRHYELKNNLSSFEQIELENLQRERDSFS